MNPTIAYCTSRKNSRFEQWFLPALARQLLPGEEVTVLKIDRFAGEFQHFSFPSPLISDGPYINVKVFPPKPCVWSGPFRLTREDWFAASSYRNTAVCLCTTSHIAYVDDLSIPTSQWWEAAKIAATFPDTITCGMYAKVNDIVFEDGQLVSFSPSETGRDRRFAMIGDKIQGRWPAGNMFGCSLIAPVESLLRVGGWPEYADGLGFEDSLMSCVLGNNGQEFRFDRRLFTYEDENAHHEEPPVVRRDKGASPNDKSHAALAIARKSRYFENYYPGSTRGLRDYYRQHGEFPVVMDPQHDWYDGQPIAEFDASKMP